MFNIGFGELILILLIGFVIVGPEDLPKVSRALARAIRTLRSLFSGARDVVLPREGADALQELKREISETREAAEQMNPVNVVKKELEGLDPTADLRGDVKDIEKMLHRKL